jgi:ankyrin repeat protein
LVTTLLGIGASVDFYGDKGLRVLMDGVVGGNTNVIAPLIGHGADVNTTYHGTPLIHVTCMGAWPKPEIVEFLLRAGAKPNVENPAGFTALDMAITYNTNLIPVLMANGGVAGQHRTVSSP